MKPTPSQLREARRQAERNAQRDPYARRQGVIGRLASRVGEKLRGAMEAVLDILAPDREPTPADVREAEELLSRSEPPRQPPGAAGDFG